MVVKKKTHKKVSKKKVKKGVPKEEKSKYPTLNLKTDHEIAMDFAVKAYKKFDKIIKSVVLFGSIPKQKITVKSDIDIIILIDDVSINWDMELTAWYREELDKILQTNPYKGMIHINTIKLSTWWDDLLKGDPVVLNILRSGTTILDHAGFIEPLKYLMIRGKIKGTPEAIFQCLQRAPGHIARSKAAELTAMDGVYWSMVDSAHGALIAAGCFPPSPEHVMSDLKEAFVDRGALKMKYVLWYRDAYYLHKKIDHREISNLRSVEIDMWQKRAEEFLDVMVKLTQKIIESSKK
jgi:predicted nucleotidyltransferase